MTSDRNQKDYGSFTDVEANQADESLKSLEISNTSDLTTPKPRSPSSEFNLRSSLAVLGAACAMFCSVGFINAFGVFQEYYAQTLLSDKSPSSISWIGSFEIFIMFGGTFVVGYLNDVYGPRPLIIVGSIITVFALFMTSLCKTYWQLFLTQALLLGFGISFAILPAFATIPRYFVAGRGLALGLTVSGSSLGGVFWPIVLKSLLYNVGFGWGVRISAFIMVPLLAFSCLTVRVPKEAPRVSGAPVSEKPKPDLSLIKNPKLLLVAAALFFTYLGLFTPFFYITSYTISLGLDSSMGFYMVSILNAASLFGRILPGILADWVGPFNVMIISIGTSGIICMCLTTATNMAGIVVLSLAYGFASGAVISLQGACAAGVGVKPQQYGVAMGIVMTILSVAGLIGSPINGQLLGAFSYLGLSLFSGLAMLIGMCIMIIARLRLKNGFLVKA